MADNFNNKTITSTIAANDYLHITQGGNHRRVEVSKLINLAKSGMLTEVEAALLDRLTNNCYILYHRTTESNGDNYAVLARASQWKAKEGAGEIASGVLLIEGGRHIVVAPTDAAGGTMHWGSVTTRCVNTAITDCKALFADFDGYNKTTAIVNSAEYGGDGADYAPGACRAYARPNANNKGLTAGKWWLPSAGELLLMYANKTKLNIMLALISGGQQFSSYYWSSTEGSETYAWRLGFNNGDLGSGNEVSNSFYVRPASAFIM